MDLILKGHCHLPKSRSTWFHLSLAGDGLTSDVSNVAAANADIAKLVVSHLGKLPDDIAVAAPRVDLLCDVLIEAICPFLPVQILGLSASSSDARLAFETETRGDMRCNSWDRSGNWGARDESVGRPGDSGSAPQSDMADNNHQQKSTLPEVDLEDGRIRRMQTKRSQPKTHLNCEIATGIGGVYGDSYFPWLQRVANARLFLRFE
jgi:hypothetical protein